MRCMYECNGHAPAVLGPSLHRACVLRVQKSDDEFDDVSTALALNLDIINLFVYIVEMMMRNRDKQRQDEDEA